MICLGILGVLAHFQRKQFPYGAASGIYDIRFNCLVVSSLNYVHVFLTSLFNIAHQPFKHHFLNWRLCQVEGWRKLIHLLGSPPPVLPPLTLVNASFSVPNSLTVKLHSLEGTGSWGRQTDSHWAYIALPFATGVGDVGQRTTDCQSAFSLNVPPSLPLLCLEPSLCSS